MQSVCGGMGISSRATSLLHLLIPILVVALGPTPAHAEEESADYSRAGFYVSLAGNIVTDESLESRLSNQVGGATEAFNEALAAAPQPPPGQKNATALRGGASTDDAYGGFNARVGYRMHPFFAAEVQTEYVADFSARILIDDSESNPALELLNTKILDRHDLWTTTANLRLIIPTGRVQLFGLGGLGLFHNKSKEKRVRFIDPVSGVELDKTFGEESGVELAVRTGGGIDFYATEHIVLNVEASYVIPFGRFDHLDYLSLSLGAAYRF